MKMPEGWINLQANCLADSDAMFAADLMKEMAEALENTCRAEPDEVNWSKANRILDRFKEWE